MKIKKPNHTNFRKFLGGEISVLTLNEFFTISSKVELLANASVSQIVASILTFCSIVTRGQLRASVAELQP